MQKTEDQRRFLY